MHIYQTWAEKPHLLPSRIFLSSHRGVELSARRSRQKGTTAQIIQACRKVCRLLFFKRFLSVLCPFLAPVHSSICRREEATLRLMLERREAELREAMKLRHSLTTVLHALRVDMERVSKTRGVLKFKPLVTAPKRHLSNRKWTYCLPIAIISREEVRGCGRKSANMTEHNVNKNPPMIPCQSSLVFWVRDPLWQKLHMVHLKQSLPKTRSI